MESKTASKIKLLSVICSPKNVKWYGYTPSKINCYLSVVCFVAVIG